MTTTWPSESGAPTFESVLRALFTNPSIRLGDLVYTVRDNEGKGWEGPDVKAWSDAVTAGRRLLGLLRD